MAGPDEWLLAYYVINQVYGVGVCRKSNCADKHCVETIMEVILRYWTLSTVYSLALHNALCCCCCHTNALLYDALLYVTSDSMLYVASFCF